MLANRGRQTPAPAPELQTSVGVVAGTAGPPCWIITRTPGVRRVRGPSPRCPYRKEWLFSHDTVARRFLSHRGFSGTPDAPRPTLRLTMTGRQHVSVSPSCEPLISSDPAKALANTPSSGSVFTKYIQRKYHTDRLFRSAYSSRSVSWSSRYLMSPRRRALHSASLSV